MANVKPLKDSGGLLAEVDPATDTIDSKLYVSGAGKVLVRTSTGAGPHEEVDINSLSFGALGTGFTDGGGSGILPDGTTAAAGENFAQITWSNVFPSGIYFNKYKYSDGTLNPYGNGAMYIGSAGVGCGIQFAPDEGRLSAIGDDGDYRNEVMYLSASGIMFKGFFVGSGLAVGSFEINENNGLMFTDSRAAPIGLTYAGDYSETVAANDRSIPDVATTKKLARKMAFLAT